MYAYVSAHVFTRLCMHSPARMFVCAHALMGTLLHSTVIYQHYM